MQVFAAGKEHGIWHKLMLIEKKLTKDDDQTKEYLKHRYLLKQESVEN